MNGRVHLNNIFPLSHKEIDHNQPKELISTFRDVARVSWGDEMHSLPLQVGPVWRASKAYWKYFYFFLGRTCSSESELDEP